MLSLLSRWLNATPAACEICDRWPAQPVCGDCRAHHGRTLPRCPGCALPLAPGLERCIRCVESPLQGLDSCVARVDYNYPWVQVVAQFKFQQQPAWARLLAQMMRETPQAQALLAQAHWVAPIPLAPSRLRERGYNQAWELVKHLGPWPQGKTRAMPDLLLRAETAQRQHDLPRAQRLAHARRAFSLHPARARHIRHAHVLLVDDVMTTGATLEAAAQVLRQAGAASVSALVLARTLPPDPPACADADME